MTSFAFILGSVPLLLASGAGAELRQALGTAVFFGMAGVTGFGLLGLASEDPERFYAGMGTVYLTRLAELASVATARYLPPA